ncbi:MAG: tetratricopeptide repeat protein [Cytophagales bacterium]|nr:tetratricopeptide repeat protein [Cytophagales bacterium]
MKPSEIWVRQAQQKAQPHFEQARALYNSNDFHNAAKQLDAALALDPNYTDALQLLGIVYAQTERRHLAVSLFKKILALEPHNHRAYNNLGQVLDDLQDFAGAISCFDKALAIDPNYAAAMTNRADTLSRMPATKR